MMRDGGLLHRKGAFEVTYAHLTTAPHQDVEDSQPNRMSEEFEIGAHTLQRIQIDARTPPRSTALAPCPVWNLNDDAGRSLSHWGQPLKYIDGCQYVLGSVPDLRFLRVADTRATCRAVRSAIGVRVARRHEPS